MRRNRVRRGPRLADDDSEEDADEREAKRARQLALEIDRRTPSQPPARSEDERRRVARELDRNLASEDESAKRERLARRLDQEVPLAAVDDERIRRQQLLLHLGRRVPYGDASDAARLQRNADAARHEHAMRADTDRNARALRAAMLGQVLETSERTRRERPGGSTDATEFP